jgi:hypothetical protein
MSRCLPLLFACLITCSFQTAVGYAAEITAEPSPNGAVVKIDGQLFTEYITKSGTRPILWPIIGPTGRPMTRDYPMREHAGEQTDHPHQRSMWFAHGDVNGTNFWAQPEQVTYAGRVEHIKFVKISSGKPAQIITQNAWVTTKGKKVCEDQRTLRFDTDGDARWIDFDITIKALDKPVTFGDDKEGTFGIRVAQSMTVDAKQGGKIVNSQKQVNLDAWGKPAAWVDYHGPIDGETVGIAIFNHPSSFRFPAYWHVRTYGLFAANSFALHAFGGGKATDGAYTIKPGRSITLRYRVYLHRGDENEGKVAEACANYSKEVK